MEKITLVVVNWSKKYYKSQNDFKFWCVDSSGETPDPIPNSEVKPASAEDSARVTWCETRTMHLLYKKPPHSGGFFFA